MWHLKVLGSVGHPIRHTEIKVVHDETGEDLPPGSKGIVKARGPQVMQGYYKVPHLKCWFIRRHKKSTLNCWLIVWGGLEPTVCYLWLLFTSRNLECIYIYLEWWGLSFRIVQITHGDSLCLFDIESRCDKASLRWGWLVKHRGYWLDFSFPFYRTKSSFWRHYCSRRTC